jgi:hypothetical protein
MVAALRSEAVLLLTFLTDHWEWHGLCLLPWGVWLWKGLGVAWPGLWQQPWYQGLGRGLEVVSGWTLVGLALMWLAQQVTVAGEEAWTRGLSLGSLMSAPYIEMEEDEWGVYHVRLGGEFELHLDGQVAFYKRMLTIFLGCWKCRGSAAAVAAHGMNAHPLCDKSKWRLGSG